MQTSDNEAIGGTGQRPPGRRRRWGSTIGLGLFTAFAGLITVVIAIDWLQAVDTWSWQETTCTIESSSVVDGFDGGFALEVRYRYHYRGESYSGDRYRHAGSESSSASDVHRLAARYAPGESVPCILDPGEPGRAYLRRADLWRGLWIFLPLLFVAVGVGSLYMVHGSFRRVEGGPDPAPVLATGAADKKKPFRAVVGMSILFGVFFLFGFGMLIPFFVWPAWQVVEARSWVAVPCEILSSGVRSHAGDDSTTYSVEALYRYRFEGREYVSSRYQFMGGSSSGYESKARRVAEIPEGAQVECFVDPDDPFESVIHRGFAADFLFGLIPLVFGLIGAGGLWFVIQMARGAKRSAALPSWKPAAAAAERVTAGPIALEPTLGPFGKLGCALFLALFWNGIVSVFLWQLVAEWRAGRPDWLLALFLTPFVIVGLLLATGVPYTLLALLNPRPRVQLSSGALRAGESVQIDWSFRGAARRVRALKIWLEGSRRETTSSESEVRTTTRKMREIEILDRGEGFPIEFGSVGVRLPRDVEPSREGPNGVIWKLKLQGRIDYWPDVGEEFEVRVVNEAFEPGDKSDE